MVKYQVVGAECVKKFFIDCLKKVGLNKEHGKDLAELLCAADYQGHYSHGLNRLGLYLDDISLKACSVDGKPIILKQNVCTAWVDGNNLLGPVVGKFCMKLAIEKAKNAGIGFVCCKGSNHFGIAGYYAMMASKNGLIGLSFTNGSPLVVSTGGKHPFLSTNPFAVSACGKSNTFLLDMATSVIALGKIEMQERKGESIPKTWAVDENGVPTSDPKKFHALLPLGGLPETSGYKGFGLGIFVEIMSAILSGSARNPNVRHWREREKVANIGHCFIAIDPNQFTPDFDTRLDDFATDIRNQEPANEKQKIMFPGDPELNRIKFNDQKCEGGIPYHPNQIKFMQEQASKFEIEMPKIKFEVDITN